MSDFRGGRFERDPFDREPREREPSLAATLEQGFRRLVTSVFVAGGLIAIAVYASGGGDDEAPRYQVTAGDGRVFRVNTESGTVIACEGERCAIVLRRGQRLEDEIEEAAPPVSGEGARAPSLPAPADPAPAQPTAPAEPAAPAPAAQPQPQR